MNIELVLAYCGRDLEGLFRPRPHYSGRPEARFEEAWRLLLKHRMGEVLLTPRQVLALQTFIAAMCWEFPDDPEGDAEFAAKAAAKGETWEPLTDARKRQWLADDLEPYMADMSEAEAAPLRPVLAALRDDTPTARWPWGDHTTPRLEHLAAAAREWWSTYDPTNSAAPTQAEMVPWLMGRGCTKHTAEAICHILTPPDLPKGPRRKQG